MFGFPQIEWFFVSLFGYYFLYGVVDKIFINNKKYKELVDDRKSYFQKNIVKTVALVGIGGIGTKVLYKGFLFNEWNNSEMYRVGYMYAALDVLGLICVKNLPMNSKIHHISSFLFSYMNTLVDYTQPTFWKGLPVYCILSSYAFGVNLFLGLRLIMELKSLGKLIEYNLWSYMGLLGVNWVYQLINLYWNGTNSWDVYMFVGLILFVANDDIKLLRFLNHHLKKVKV